MIVSFLFLLLCLSGSFLGIVFLYDKPLRLVPVSIMTTVGLLYLSGLAGILEAGFYIISLFVVIIYAFFALAFCMKKEVREVFIKSVPRLLIVLGIFAVLNYCDKGMLAHNFDEFNHWADVVKIMTRLNDFSTNPASDAWYKSYPPAMALLQYYLQKLNMTVQRGNGFAEWRLYLAYHAFMFSLYLPILEEEKRSAFQKGSLMIMAVSLPVYFFPYVFDATMIDFFLAILSGITVSMVFLCRKKEWWHYLFISLSAMTLTLSKDVGLVFALLFSVVLFIDQVSEVCAGKDGSKKEAAKSLLLAGGPALAALLSKLSWNAEFASSGTEAKFSGKIIFSDFFGMLFFHNGTDFRQEVVDKAVAAFAERNMVFLFTKISYLDMLIVLSLVLVICSFYMFKKKQYSSVLSLFLHPIAVILLVVLYAVFIAACYAYKFAKSEALGLASYDRYMNIPFLVLGIIALFTVVECFNESEKKNVLTALLCYGVIFCINLQPVSDYLGREFVDKSISYRQEYDLIVQTIENNCPEEAKVYFVSENDEGLDLRIVRYSVRPVSIANEYKESRLATLPKSKKTTPKEWMDTLTGGDFEYVAIHSVDEALAENFGECFENVEDIQADTLFYLDKERRLLVRCSG